jgi:hypothetical protein
MDLSSSIGLDKFRLSVVEVPFAPETSLLGGI